MSQKRYLAKSKPEETIQEHTDNLLKELKILKTIYENIDVNWALLELACLIHDVGKIEKNFQDRIKGQIKFRNLNKIEVPHGALSVLFLDTKGLLKKGYSLNDIMLLYRAVFFHHHRLRLDNIEAEEINEKRESLTEQLKEFKYDKLENLKVFPFKENYLSTDNIDDKDDEKRYIILKGLLNRIDYAASAHIPIENPNNFLESSLENFMNTLKEKEKLKGNYDIGWNELQKFMHSKQDENLIVVAQTGLGKTEASLLWLGNNKGFFTLPIRTAINAIYDRLVKNIVKDEKIEDKVGLLHSETLSVYYEMNNSDKEENHGEESIKIEEYYTKTRQLSLPITVCTLDQLFPMVFKYRNYEQVLATLSYSKIIIDEIQMYGPNLLGYLISGLLMIQKMGGKFAIVTATFPGFLKKLMKEKGLNFTIPENKYFIEKNKIRHSVKWIQEQINSNFIIEKSYNNRIIVICNTVKKCQQLYSEIKINNPNLDVNLFHAKFIKSDRLEKEKQILKFGQLYNDDGTENKGCGIWITTSLAEVSLDIDFDLLITELSDINSLIQRLGRCFRKRIWQEGFNCFVFDGGGELCSGVGNVIDKEIFNLSKIKLREYFNNNSGILNEEKKMELVEDIYSYENIKNTKYYESIIKFIDQTGLYLPGEIDKSKAQKQFRDIQSVTVIPEIIYEKNNDIINNCLEILMDKDKDILEKVKARDKIYSFTLNISYEEFKNIYQKKHEIEIGKYEKIIVIYSEYDSELGLRKKNL